MKTMLFTALLLISFNVSAACTYQYACDGNGCSYRDVCDSQFDQQSAIGGIGNERPLHQQRGVILPGDKVICENKMVNGVLYKVCY
jgi:hypothetical protein